MYRRYRIKASDQEILDVAASGDLDALQKILEEEMYQIFNGNDEERITGYERLCETLGYLDADYTQEINDYINEFLSLAPNYRMDYENYIKANENYEIQLQKLNDKREKLQVPLRQNLVNIFDFFGW